MEINNNADYLDQLNNYLPRLQEKAILAFGIGQLELRTLATTTKNLTAVTKSQVELDELTRSCDLANVKILQSASLNGLALPQGQKFDLIYLESAMESANDQEAAQTIQTALELLELNGFLYFREACTQKIQSGGNNKSPKYYIDLLETQVQETGPEKKYGLDLVFVKPDQASSSGQADVSKISFLYTKIQVGDFHGFKTLQEFLDHKQYTMNGILRYEKIFGEGFVSTGGYDTTVKFLKELDLKPGQRVLDVGCGIGGGDFLMAKLYGVEVLGIDLSSNMIGIAWDRALGQQNSDSKVQFEIGDVLKQSFPNNTFDLIYSRDTLLHINQKPKLFAKFKDWLKPGGKIFISDYCCGEKPWSDDYAAYVEQRGYDLHTPKAYGQIFVDLGFESVQADDVTDLFLESLRMELAKMELIKEDFVKEFSLDDYNYLIDGWQAKVERSTKGDQRWGTFYCVKPIN